MNTEILIHRRFCGPPDSGNGGYSAGALARFIDGPAEVTLLAPPPLDTRLRVEASNEQASLYAGEKIVARARPGRVTIPCLPPPTFGEAEAASARYAGFDHHLLPGCFVCGPARAPSDGLRVFAGADPTGSYVAAPWTPDGSLANLAGRIGDEFVWAALDCPSYFGLMTPGLLALLGRMTAEISGPLVAGGRYIVAGWPVSVDGRKHHAGSAIFTEDGRLVARAEATWVELTAAQRAA